MQFSLWPGICSHAQMNTASNPVYQNLFLACTCEHFTDYYSYYYFTLGKNLLLMCRFYIKFVQYAITSKFFKVMFLIVK